MASIGHVIVGLALAQAHALHTDPKGVAPPRTAMKRAGALVTLAMLPDADVVAFAVGIPYAHAFGHRGASHSIVFALVVGALAAVPLARWLRAPLLSTALATIAAVLSHPLLDMLSDGGLGCALYWPFSAARHFFSVQPIPVAPIGAAFLSARGLTCIVVEVALLSPLLLWLAVSARRRAR